MAFEGDQCRLCERAENELNEIVNKLSRTGARTKPVLLSHFPLYRASDANCSKWLSTSIKVKLLVCVIKYILNFSLLLDFYHIKNVIMFFPKKQLNIF